MIRSLLLSLSLLSWSCAVVIAQSLVGTELEIGPPGSDQFRQPSGGYPPNRRYSGAIGENNNITGSMSLAIGENNKLSGLWLGSIENYVAVGEGNMGGFTGEIALMVGIGNYSSGYSAMAVGTDCYSSSASLAIGFNTQSEGNSLSVGRFSFASSGYNEDTDYYYGGSSAVIGTGLQTMTKGSLVVGRYNEPRWSWDDSGPVFAIGNGTSFTASSTIFEVFASGKIQISRQGNVLMGSYGFVEP